MNKQIEPLGIIVTIMASEWYKRNIFDSGLWLWQKLILWYKYRDSVSFTMRKLGARFSHWRLVIEVLDNGNFKVLNQTWPMIKIDTWRPEIIDNQKFMYFAPTFRDEITPYFEQVVKELSELHATRSRGRKYDVFQIISFIFHTPIWVLGDILKKDWWGQEKFKTFNIPGGHEVCSTRIAVILREASLKIKNLVIKFFPDYDPQMTAPFLLVITKLWKLMV